MRAALAAELLRAHINERAASTLLHRQPAHGITETARYTKVRHLQVAPLIHHQVGRLQITMDDLRLIVRIIERVTKLTGPGSDLIRLKDFLLFLSSQVRKRFAIDVLHRNAAGAFVMHEVVNPDDMGMSQLK